MFNLNVFVDLLNTLPTEIISVVMFCVSLTSMLLFLRFFGKAGLFVFLAFSVIIGNIQVLKAVKFSWFEEPVALGTIVFSMTYLCTDILTEYFDKHAAKTAVWISFSGMLFVTIIMILTMGWTPLSPKELGPGYDRFRDAHEAMKILFLPAPAIFLASLTAYLLSQYNDIWIFHSLKVLLRDKFVGLRSFLSTSLSALIDSTIFSVLAWVVFAATPMPLSTLIKTYILGTYGLRLFLAAINAPIVRLVKNFLPRESHARVS